MAKRSGVEAAVAGAEAEEAKARAALSEAEARTGADDDARDETASRALSAAIGIARDGNDAGRPRAADRIRQERSDELDDCMLELRPWRGDKDALLTISIPRAEQLEGWASNEAGLARSAAQQQSEVDRLAAETARLDSRILALGSAEGIVSDQEAEVRAAREAAWTSHTNTLDATTA
jgi:hypothetical protein